MHVLNNGAALVGAVPPSPAPSSPRPTYSNDCLRSPWSRHIATVLCLYNLKNQSCRQRRANFQIKGKNNSVILWLYDTMIQNITIATTHQCGPSKSTKVRDILRILSQKAEVSSMPVSHAIVSSMQYYPKDIIAYAVMSVGRFCICNRVRPDAAA